MAKNTADDDGQLRILLQAGFSLPARFWLAGHLGGWNRIAQMPMLFHVAVSPGGHKVLKRVVTLTCALGVSKSVSLAILTRSCEGLSTDGYHDRP